MNGGIREILKGRLMGAGLVDDPSYLGSTVDVREKPRTDSGMVWRPWW